MAGLHRHDAPRRRGRTARWVAALAGAAFLGGGAWAFADPRSFFDLVATFPPYNEHFLHDLGSFEVGFGAILLLAVVQTDALVAALGGVGIGTAVHAVSHALDIAQGGRASDPWVLGVAAALLVGGAAWRWRGLRGAQGPEVSAQG